MPKFLTYKISSNTLHHSRVSVVWNQPPVYCAWSHVPCFKVSLETPPWISLPHCPSISLYTSTKLNHSQFSNKPLHLSSLFLPTWQFFCIGCLSILPLHLPNIYSFFKTQFKSFNPEHIFWALKNKKGEREEESHLLKSIISFNHYMNIWSIFSNHPKFTIAKAAAWRNYVNLAQLSKLGTIK